MKQFIKRVLIGLLAASMALFLLPLSGLAAPLEGAAFDYSAKDANGDDYPAVSGKADDSVRIVVPLICRDTTVTDITVSPVVGDVEVFPFNVTQQDYTKQFIDYYFINDATGQHVLELVPGALYEISFHFTISKDATKGTKSVAFEIKYRSGGNEMVQTYSVPVVITQDASSKSDSGSSSGSSGGSSFRSAPKVILDEISFSSDTIYAGDTFELALDFVNTSEREAIRNMQVSISDETGTVLPANDSSNTKYIDRIEKNGGLRTLIFTLQATPGAEAKSFMLKIDYSYDGVSTRAEFKNETTVAVPVQQKTRVRFDNPVIYDEAWVGQSVSVSVQMFNMGKSVVYNAMVAVEGDGLSLEEMYFGGNVAAGSTMRAEFNVLTNTPGQIDGFIVMSFEDVYGNVTEERLPISLFVNEAAPVEAPMMDGALAEGADVPLDGPEEAPADEGVRIFGLPWYVPALILLGLILLLILLILRAKKKRARELMEL